RVNQDRVADMIVLYNTSGTTTNTNEWGREVTVTNSIVTSVNGYNNTGPNKDDSYVVSGHGKGEAALAEVVVGMTAIYDAAGKTVTFKNDADREMRLLEVARTTAAAARTAAYEGCYVPAENADERFAAAETQFSALKKSFNSDAAAKLIEEYNTIASLYRDREAAEYRGVWILPMQKNMQEVEQFVRECKQSGLNAISVEALIAGTTVYPTPAGSDFVQNPIYEGFDVLGAFVEMGKKYGIEIHCWMHTFSLGDKGGAYESIAFASKHPEWHITGSNGEYDGYMLEPAYDELQDTLIENYRYILETYDIDAFELDTIRYPNVENGMDYGYGADSIALFKQAYPQYVEQTITYDTKADYWDDWVTFRADNVSRMVKRVRDLIDEIRPDVLLSADVGAVVMQTRTSAYQDSRRWMKEEWIDILHPMAYGEGDDINVKPIFSYTQDNGIVVPALGDWLDGWDAGTVLNQVCDMLDIGCQGTAHFANEDYFGKNCDDLLLETLYTEDTVAPGLNLANTAVTELERFMLRVNTASERGFIGAEAKTALLDAAETVVSEIKTNGTAKAEALLDSTLTAVSAHLSEGTLRTRLEKDIAGARWAVLVNRGNDTYTETEESSSSPAELPEAAKTARKLTIDKINSVHIGEDAVLITDPAHMEDCGVNWTQVLLLKPVAGTTDRYELVEAHHNWGIPVPFETPLTDGMIAASFHTTEGTGKERHDLSTTFTAGTVFVLYGIDVEKENFTALDAMLYVYNDTIVQTPAPDASEMELKLPIKRFNVAHAGDDSILVTDAANLDQYTVNWAYVMLLEPVGGSGSRFRVVESFHNWGEAQPFKTPITEGMIAASFHSVGIPEAVETEQTAMSIAIGTELVLFGIDVENEVITSLTPMLYIPTAVWENPFIDINSTDTYYNAVRYVFQNALFRGISAEEFAPDMTMTRAMFVTVLGRLAGVDVAKYTDVSFDDVVPGAWYAPYVEWAADQNVVLGYGNGLFGVNDDITVEQAVSLLARYAKMTGIDIQPAGDLAGYTDADKVSSWASDQMTWAVSKGIYRGNDGMLNPKSPASRALVAEMLYGFDRVY
ncbi:MAG: S-layer homology domain-containing protein, partial [Clostridia bacterium]|nr:S-layer homology domain-containing protein [Clostridia bacterium]